MAFKDKAAKYAYDVAWQKENSIKLTVRVMNSSGIPAALEVARNDSGLTNSGYVIAALREKLIRDGYLTEKQESAK